ncbi:MAG: hypothetical protein H0X63_03780 [Flavobacteriales bacterium]|nr:hypothetical protein [Flavobacteriales bacterium]
MSKIENDSIRNISFLLVEKLCNLLNVDFDNFTKPDRRGRGERGLKN